ncbi:MAG: hypothetical protein RLZZ628_2958 [Bacteroidota bacterium]
MDEWKLFKERDVSLLAKIKIIKNTRTTNKQERINQLGNDPDRKTVILTEGEAAYDLEEIYGYFERYQRVNPSDPKGDWISLSGTYKNKTFDEFGGGFTLVALKMFDFDPKQKRKFFQSVDLHFIEANYVILNLTLMKQEVPAFYNETIQYIKEKYGIIKLINITK